MCFVLDAKSATTLPEVSGCFLLDTKSAITLPIPKTKYVMHLVHLVLVASAANDGNYMAAELQMIASGGTADLLCFSSQAGEWAIKSVAYPLPSR
jgi:hypothetical protein